MFGRSVHFEDDGTSPVVVSDFHAPGSRASHSSSCADDGGGLDFEGSTVDEALDDSVALRRGNLHFVVAEGDRLADLGKEGLEGEVCEGTIGGQLDLREGRGT